MAAPSKYVIGYGLLSKLEASYNAGGALSTSTDGVILEELAQLKISYANDGARPAAPGTAGYQQRVAPSGGFADLTAKVAPKGSGSAYSASVTPNIHSLLRACGFDGTLVTTGGSESWTYTPTPLPSGGFGSDVQSLYARGQLYPLTGMIGDVTFDVTGPAVPVATFAMKGLIAPNLISEVTLPAITYPALGFDAPKAVSLGLNLFGVSTFVVRKATFKMNRLVNPRLDVNATGHAGFAPGRRTPQLDVEIETPLFSASNLFVAFNAATVASTWSLGTFGAAQYNRYAVSGPKAQLMAPPEETSDGEVSITKLSLQLNPSTWGASDEVSWLFN
jgi:hypothetical protein